ncbi:hypothetical protein H5410_026792 [Solanum commersonii]|uniref:NB-ARC domain-containing protein n=1 Tax=Solanum commersonii TaxID=4109 RepID=A0A9J5Z1N2_SOLCO|nr:hypothetical protein H5410_026792 [Solanum commersonii]
MATLTLMFAQSVMRLKYIHGKILLTKRFIILTDDVWDNLHMCFKDAQNGSKIILIIRLNDVAFMLNVRVNPHHHCLFRDDGS